MKTDNFTKIVLTLIAACLLIQVVQSVMFGQFRVNAQASNRSEVNIVGITKSLANESGNALRVHITNPQNDPGWMRTIDK